MKRLIFALIALLMYGTQAFAGNLGGIWWNKNESGWGVNFSQQADVIFASIFVYRPSGQPVWYVSTMRSTTNAPGTFGGDLFETTGLYFGAGPFIPSAVSARRVGAMNFVATSGTSGTLNYTVDGVSITKSIEPQPLAPSILNGTYAATILGLSSNNCPLTASPANANRVTISNNNTFQLSTSSGQAICSGTGTFTQAGERYTFVANNPSCLTGGGTLTLLDLKTDGIAAISNVNEFVTGVIVIVNSNRTCDSSFFFAGVNVE